MVFLRKMAAFYQRCDIKELIRVQLQALRHSGRWGRLYSTACQLSL